LRLLASDPRVTIITCLRDPLERFISNFNFDFWSGYTHCKSIEEYVNSSGSFTMFNYYCRILSQHNENPKPITIREFQEAKFLLSLFDYLVILEKQDTFWGLNEFLGWEEKVMRQKQNQLKKRKLVKFFKRKKFALDWKQLTNHQIKPDQNFLKKFREFNEFDNQIYLDAKTKNLLNL
jgi:hypothetical protein